MDPVKPLRCTAASAMGAPGRHVPGASGVMGSPARNRLLEPLHVRYSFLQVVCLRRRMGTVERARMTSRASTVTGSALD